MKRQIVEKLDNSLKNFESEADVVYILTRIGKLLELDDKWEEFPILDFYRNWSVHASLDRKKHPAVIEYIEGFIRDKENRDSLLFHKPLIKQLNEFLNDYGLQDVRSEQRDLFIFLLGKIIADTPIIIGINDAYYEISISEPVSRDQSGTYKISVKVNVEPVKMKITIPPVEVKYEEKIPN